ncbi:MAG: hypothetical protein AB7O98_11265 [Hyphomonadaceae bacterium]
MTFSADPIRLQPRMLPRRWGRKKVHAWCEGAPHAPTPVGEIWIAHAHNTTADGAQFGALLAETPQSMLGDLGRAPPTLRLVTTADPSDPILAEGPIALWRILEAPLDARVNVYDRTSASPRDLRCRRGDLFRVGDGARLVIPGGVTALEACANFTPNNTPSAARAQRLLAASEKRHRAAWLRDPAMSVELWTLPKLSFLEPDGGTCHVLMALTPGVTIDGQPLNRGDAVFLPAEGRRVSMIGEGAQVVTVYPDLVPTEIWKQPQPPRPAALALDPAIVGGAPTNLEATMALRPAA